MIGRIIPSQSLVFSQIQPTPPRCGLDTAGSSRCLRGQGDTALRAMALPARPTVIRTHGEDHAGEDRRLGTFRIGDSALSYELAAHGDFSNSLLDPGVRP